MLHAQWLTSWGPGRVDGALGEQQADSSALFQGHGCETWHLRPWSGTSHVESSFLTTRPPGNPLSLLCSSIYRFIRSQADFWLHRAFVAALLWSPRVGTILQLWCVASSLRGLLFLQSTSSRARVSVAVALRLSHPVACGIFPDQGSNLCPLPWQADS